MFADAAANTFLDIHIGPLESNLNFNFTAGRRGFFEFLISGNCNGVLGVCGDFGASTFFNSALIIAGGLHLHAGNTVAGGELIRDDGCFDFYIVIGDSFYR